MNVKTANKANSEDTYDAGQYFRSMAQFVGFGEEDRQAIKDSQFIIEKHIPVVVGKFYDHLLRYPPTRKYFLHRGGPIAAGTLSNDTLTCPWHGYEFNLCNGELLMDPSASLETYTVELHDGDVYVRVPTITWDEEPKPKSATSND